MSKGTAVNGVRMSPHRGDHPSQTEDRSRQLKNGSTSSGGETESRGCNWKEDCVIRENDKPLFEVQLEIPALVKAVAL